MTTRTKIKRKIEAGIIIVMVVTVTAISGIMPTVIANQTLKMLIAKARQQLKYWGTDTYRTLGSPPALDPGAGGGSGFLPNHYLKTLLLYDAAEELNNKQVQILKGNFSDYGYFLFSSYAEDTEDFLQDLKDANTVTVDRLCLAFVGEGTLAKEDGETVPVLVMRDGNTIQPMNIKTFRRTLGDNYNWHIHAVFLYSCYSLYNSRLAYEFSKMGAKIVLGFEDKVEQHLAEEVTNIFWENYRVNETSLEEAYDQTKEAFEYAHSIGKKVMDWLKEAGNWIIENILTTLVTDPSLFRLLILWLIDIIIANFKIAIAILLVLIAIMVILFILWDTPTIAFPLAMIDYDTASETEI